MSNDNEMITQAFEIAYGRTHKFHAMTVFLDNVMGELRDRFNGADSALQQAYDTLRSRLLDKEREAWMEAQMWGLGAGGEMEERVRNAVRERFLGEGMHVMWHLDPQKQIPGGWSSEAETEFRRQINEAFSRRMHGSLVSVEPGKEDP